MHHSKQIVTINQQQTSELAFKRGRGLTRYLSWSWAMFISHIYLKANQNTFKQVGWFQI